MTSERHAVRITIGGEEFTVRSELPPEYTREVAAYFDGVLRQLRSGQPTLEAQKAALLAGLAVTDELFLARRGDADMAKRMSVLADDVARLLPPSKRGGRPSGAKPSEE